MKMMRVMMTGALAAAMSFGAVGMQAQISPTSAGGKTASTENFTDQQLVTATVHQAWEMSGKNEEVFFGIVT
ncbi:MAG: hypothetical protein ABI142_00130, partial [Bryocella sp.]